MATLTGSTIASSYDQLLALPSGGGNGSTLVALTDGNAGNTFALQISTGEVKSTGTLNVAGITTLAGDLRLEDDAGGQYVGIASPATVTTYTVTMPAAVGSTGQVLETSDGAGTLAWVTREVGDITGVTAGTNLSGGGTSGTVTLNVDNPVVADLTGDVTGNADTATTAATVTSAAQTAITSVGTLTSLAVTGNLTVDTDTLYVDSSNDRVGIGRTPSVELDVKMANTGLNGIQLVNWNNQTVVGIRSHGATADGEIYINDTSEFARIGLRACAASYFLDGLGVGQATAATYALEVAGSISATENLLIGAQDDSESFIALRTTSYDPHLVGAAGLFKIANSSNEGKVTVDISSGCVGVGEAPGTYAMQIASGISGATAGGIYSSTNADGGQAVYGVVGDADSTGTLSGIRGSVAPAVDGSASIGYAVYGNCAGSPTTGYGVYGSAVGTGSTTNHGGYFTASGATNNYGLIVDAGFVGIGTTTPGGTLHISNSDDASNGTILLGSATYYGVIKNEKTTTGKLDLNSVAASGTAHGVTLSVDGTAKFTMDYLGRCGIGVSDPDSELEINGQIKITDSTKGAGKVLTSDADGLATWVAPTTGDITGVTAGTNLNGGGTSGDVTLNLDNPVVANLTGNASGSSGSCTGNAATVTTNANLTGDVTSSGNATTIATGAVDIAMLSATGTASSSTYLRGDNAWTAISGSGDVSKVGTPVDNQVGVWTGDGTIEGDANLVWDGTNSRLGIKRTPSVELDVKMANTGVNGIQLVNWNNQTVVGIAGDASSSNGVIYINNTLESARVALRAGADSYFLDSVGIGTAVPTAKLFIQGASTERSFQAVGAGTTIGTGYFYTNAVHTGTGTNATVSVRSDNTSASGDVLHVYGAGTGDLLTLNHYGTDRLVVNSGGQVSQPVKTSTPAADAAHEIDFDDSNLQTVTINAGSSTFELTTKAASRIAGRTVKLRVVNAASLTEITVPSGWTEYWDSSEINSFAYLSYGYDLLLNLTCWGTADSDITVGATLASS